MARKQVIVQLDDRLVRDLDREAKKRGMSRSELIRRAATAFLDALEEAEAVRQTIEGYQRIPDDPAETEAFMKLAIEAWPEW